MVTNDVVIGMFEDGLEDEIIIQVIKSSEVDFDVSPATLVEAHRAEPGGDFGHDCGGGRGLLIES